MITCRTVLFSSKYESNVLRSLEYIWKERAANYSKISLPRVPLIRSYTPEHLPIDCPQLIKQRKANVHSPKGFRKRERQKSSIKGKISVFESVQPSGRVSFNWMI